MGFGGMRILRDSGDREVRDHVGGSEHREGDHDEARHGEHEWARERHHPAILARAPGEWRCREQDRHGEREKKSEEAGFGDHERIPTRRSAWTELALTFGSLLFARSCPQKPSHFRNTHRGTSSWKSISTPARHRRATGPGASRPRRLRGACNARHALPAHCPPRAKDRR